MIAFFRRLLCSHPPTREVIARDVLLRRGFRCLDCFRFRVRR